MIKLFPVLLFMLGIGGGIFGGLQLRPSDASKIVEGKDKQAEAKESDEKTQINSSVEFIKLNNQFVVPVIGDDAVKSLVVVSLGLEVSTSDTSRIFSSEPKLRDAFLQVLFDHANVGGFDSKFTNSRKLEFLKEALTAEARKILGESVVGVLVTDLARQDV